jgi:REP element-mobilizing transposase RayT
VAPDRRIWHHVVLTTYGAWLYGDARGFRTRHHREHVEGDYKSPPPRMLYEARARRSRASLVQPPVTIPAGLKERLGRAMWRELTRCGAWVLVMAVSGQHVHLLVKAQPGRIRHLAGRAKRQATLELRSNGWQGRLWGVRSKADCIRDRAHQQNVFRYIERHVREGAWVGVWKEDPAVRD